VTVVLHEKLALILPLRTHYTHCICLSDSDSMINVHIWSMAEYSAEKNIV